MGKNWIFHVRHNAKPSTVLEVLSILQGQERIDINRMLKIGEERGTQLVQPPNLHNL
jgi:hypothetical protein